MAASVSAQNREDCSGQLTPLVRIRQHRGGLHEAMATTAQIPRNMASLCLWLTEQTGRNIQPADVQIEPYGYDDRIGWDTHLIKIFGIPFAFSDGLIPVTPISER